MVRVVARSIGAAAGVGAKRVARSMMMLYKRACETLCPPYSVSVLSPRHRICIDQHIRTSSPLDSPLANQPTPRLHQPSTARGLDLTTPHPPSPPPTPHSGPCSLSSAAPRSRAPLSSPSELPAAARPARRLTLAGRCFRPSSVCRSTLPHRGATRLLRRARSRSRSRRSPRARHTRSRADTALPSSSGCARRAATRRVVIV